MSEEELNKIKKSLRSVLISCPEGTPINKVESDYRTFMGVSLSYQQFGHRNVESFLRSIPDTVRFNGAITYGVACEEIKHVTKLINNQRKVTSAVKRVQRAKYYPPSFQNAPRPQGGSYNKYPPRQPPHYAPQYKPPMQYSSYPPFGQSRPPGSYGAPGQHGPPRSHGPPGSYGAPGSSHGPPGSHGPPSSHGPHGPHGHHGPHGAPPHQIRYGPFPPPVGPPMPPRAMHPTAPGPQYGPISPPPVQDDIAEELIFSNNEIIDLLLKENIPKSQLLVQILSLAFPYIYRGSHITIIELSIPLCIDIATGVALDLEEELDGTPAILVVKMQEFHDFCVLESSEKVKRFKSNEFRDTKAKVMTLSFLDMISLLNTNNEHFYKSTTFVIFVDVHEGHMPLLNTLLPPELQYLFLLTCVAPKMTLYTQPYIMIRKWSPTQFTDVAYGRETLIENLQDKLTYLNEIVVPKVIQEPPKVVQNSAPVVNGDSPAVPQTVNGAKHSKFLSPALKQLAEATLKANINLFIQAGPNKGKTSILLELAVSKVDISLDQLQIVLTTPNPKTSGQLFIRLKEYVYAKEITEVRAFGYTEGSFDKLNLYLTEQKVHILVIENSHLFSLISKNPSILKYCRLLGCDELYGSFYTKQVPTTIANCFGKLYSHSTQVIVIAHPSENEDILHPHIPKPSWHIKEHPSSTTAKEKYIVTFFNAN